MGVVFLRRNTPGDIDKARDRFDRALDANPAYAPAWSGLANCYELKGTLGGDTDECYRLGKRCALRAINLDSNLVDAHRCLATISWQFDWEFELALTRFADLIRRFPNEADLHIAYSDCAANLGRTELAIEQATLALRLDPVSPWINTMLAQALHMGGHHAAAAAQAKIALEIEPNFAFALFFDGLASFFEGAEQQGLAQLERAAASNRPDFAIALLVCLIRSGVREPAEQFLTELNNMDQDTPALAPAILLCALGRSHEAEPYLRSMVASRDFHLLLFLFEPMLNRWQQDPIIQRYCAQLKLNPA